MKKLIDSTKKTIDYIEPQSMNFDKKVNKAYSEFVKKFQKTEQSITEITNQVKSK